MMKLKIIISFSAFLIIVNLKAQQLPVYTQYVFNEYIMNPAIAGTVDHTPLRFSYRDQWSGFTDSKGNNVAPKTFAFSAHTPVSNSIGLGGLIVITATASLR